MAAICFSAIHPTLSAATSSLTILDFGNAANAVTTSKFVEDGFTFETTLDSGLPGSFILRNPSTGLLNLNGLNTVPYNGSQYIVPFTSSTAWLRTIDAQPFSLISIDVAEYSAVPNLNSSIRFTGLRGNGTTITSTLNINRPVLGQMGDFQTLTFDGNWSSLTSLKIQVSDSNFRFSNGFSADNIVLSVIPEPESSCLLALSLMAVFFRRRES